VSGDQLALGLAVDLDSAHYLGRSGSRARLTYEDEFGLIVFSSPSSRMLPTSWLELSRWCLRGSYNGGSAQWRRARRWLAERSGATTVVSYSDPSVGHTGALYRACGWLWAPTWHRLRPPPTQAGIRGGKRQAVKDRWIWPLRRDADRAQTLALRDDSLRARFPWAEFVEPTWRGNRFTGGGGDFNRWRAAA
jgi:hypothetical protein